MALIQSLIEFISYNHLWETPKTFERNEIVSDKTPFLYFIINGCAKITTIIDEKEQIIRLGYKNSVIVDLDLFLDRKASRYTIQIIKKTSIKMVSKEHLILALKRHDKIEFWIDVLEELISQQAEREFDLLNKSAKIRYERVLKRSPQLFQEVPHKYIASYLKMNSETLSRLHKS